MVFWLSAQSGDYMSWHCSTNI